MVFVVQQFSNILFHPQCLRKVSAYIAMQNELVYNPKGLNITDPVLRGLRVIEISIDRPLTNRT